MRMLPGEISDRAAKQFLQRYKRSDPRCNTDELYCETNKISCMVMRYIVSYALKIRVRFFERWLNLSQWLSQGRVRYELSFYLIQYLNFFDKNPFKRCFRF